MSTPAVIINGTNVPRSEVNESRTADELDYAEKYAQERNKRLGKGMKQNRQLEKSKDLLETLVWKLEPPSIKSSRMGASEATKRSGATPIIQPSSEGEQNWMMRILAGAVVLASIRGCTPGYRNWESEFDQMTQEEQILGARQSPWTKGIADYARVLEEWQAEGGLQGLEVIAQQRGK